MENTTIFFSISNLKVVNAQHLLEEAGIKVHTINKLDSAHAGVFGDIELHVRKEDEEKARAILEEAEIL